MSTHRSLLLALWLPLAACPSDDPTGTDTEGEGSTGTTGASTTSPRFSATPRHFRTARFMARGWSPRSPPGR